MSRTFSVLLKSRHASPTRNSDVVIAREALTQEAAAANCIIAGDVRCTHASYADAEALYVAVYTAEGITAPPASLRCAGPGTVAGVRRPPVEVAAIRAHRTELHSSRLVAEAVTEALDAPPADEHRRRAQDALGQMAALLAAEPATDPDERAAQRRQAEQAARALAEAAPAVLADNTDHDRALRALIALHLLRMPVDTNMNLMRASIMVGHIFAPKKRGR